MNTNPSHSFFTSVEASGNHPPVRNALETLLSGIRELRWCLGALLLSAFSMPVRAQNVLTDIRGNLADMIQVVFFIISVAGFLVAGWMIITGAISYFTDREGGVTKFIVGIVIAVMMTVIVTYFVDQGDNFIAQIRGD